MQAGRQESAEADTALSLLFYMIFLDRIVIEFATTDHDAPSMFVDRRGTLIACY